MDPKGASARALKLAEELLELLDTVPGLPGDIGAHLDLAIHRLRGHIDAQAGSPWPKPGKDFRD